MRILLDSRDLIDLIEPARPVALDRMNTFLRDNNHEFVLTFTNIVLHPARPRPDLRAFTHSLAIVTRKLRGGTLFPRHVANPVKRSEGYKGTRGKCYILPFE